MTGAGSGAVPAQPGRPAIAVEMAVSVSPGCAAILDEVVDQERADPEFWETWDQSASHARLLLRITRYRAERGLNQARLARAVARLERGEQPPSLSALARMTAGTGIELRLDVSNGAVA